MLINLSLLIIDIFIGKATLHIVNKPMSIELDRKPKREEKMARKESTLELFNHLADSLNSTS
jgi:hypothetical protein